GGAQTHVGRRVVRFDDDQLFVRIGGFLKAAGTAVGAPERQVGTRTFRRFLDLLKPFLDGNDGGRGRGSCIFRRGGLGGGLGGRSRSGFRPNGARQKEKCNEAAQGGSMSERVKARGHSSLCRCGFNVGYAIDSIPRSQPASPRRPVAFTILPSPIPIPEPTGA